jgi:hypothetical protein
MVVYNWDGSNASAKIRVFLRLTAVTFLCIVVDDVANGANLEIMETLYMRSATSSGSPLRLITKAEPRGPRAADKWPLAEPRPGNVALW